ncbi:phospholipase C, phosphocholine-specific [Ottowia sp.]|uniref:phosphocholine-specific phospholipase C n=1 Tax=Ottowia sp. TaxID=1898956 RepID=UPI002D07A48F|nr:phospholipase C, phosphocholine-specific [Ottowia sp.]HOB67251.1 phospholipase C, phosphocholine-specific [Ottowia sp.]HPZ55758.1 phospholipase C, phosphocholine-specific [Ottowia sp.]HQD46375.1 phospholipase C, phosphocholine-specific [Ottowia sp.]
MANRRQFIQAAAALGALSAYPESIRRALAIPAYNASGTIKDVAHVVILMQENRSFDNYFGTLAGVRGFGDRFTIPLPRGRTVWQQDDGQGNAVLPYRLDQSAGNAQRVKGTPHSWIDARDAWDKGRMSAWVKFKQPQSMSFYGQQELPFQFALAQAFTVCDAYFCSLHGGTNTNRLFHMTGTNGPGVTGKSIVNNFWDELTPGLTGASPGYDWTTYPERLQQAGVSWKVYQNMPENYTDNCLAGFKQYRQANIDSGKPVYHDETPGYVAPPYDPALDVRAPLYKGIANTMPDDGGLLAGFERDVQGGQLPQVSWIVAPATYSEHPNPSSPVQGAWYTQRILDILTANPDVWSRTVFIINFDENDGYFDHVPPPCAPSREASGQLAGKTTLPESALAVEYYTHPSYAPLDPKPGHWTQPDGDCYGPGPRVPMYIVSPWSRGGWVNSQVTDHTSVLRFLETRFGVAEPNISAYRRAVFGDLSSAFNFATPNQAPLATLPGRSTRAAADSLRAAQQALPPIAVPAQQSMPRQAPGDRPSHALPYELHTSARVDAAAPALRLLFANTGTAAAVFHVYDRLHLQATPRRYMVEAGKQLDDGWNLAADAGRYDLWVLGPNGYHRAFVGQAAQEAGASAARPEVQVCYDPARGDVVLHLVNGGKSPCTVTVTPDAVYGGATQQAVLDGQCPVTELRFDLQSSGRWYDLLLTSSHDPAWRRRVAGRVETGQAAITDPAMGRLG